MVVLKEHEHCINCRKPAHFVKQYPCGQKCRKCQKAHHTSLHIDKEAPKQTKEVCSLKQTPGTSMHHLQLGGHHPVVFPCQVQIVSVDDSTMKPRALMDSASSTSFLTKSLAQCPHLRPRRHSMKVSAVGGSATHISSRTMANLNIVNDRGKCFVVEAVVLPEVTTDLPSSLVQFNCKWNGTPGSVDLLLGADVFSCTALHGQQFGPSGSPSGFKTCFSWVLVGDTHNSSHSN